MKGLFLTSFTWHIVVGIILGVVMYFLPKWLSDDIKQVESVMSIPVIDLHNIEFPNHPVPSSAEKKPS
jgi:xanthine/uracil/vitamin C permease (AzgA family)